MSLASWNFGFQILSCGFGALLAAATFYRWYNDKRSCLRHHGILDYKSFHVALALCLPQLHFIVGITIKEVEEIWNNIEFRIRIPICLSKIHGKRHLLLEQKIFTIDQDCLLVCPKLIMTHFDWIAIVQ